MAWKEPSKAEQDLAVLLKVRGVEASWAKIRRWREFGALPWGHRRGLGRGAGSASAITADTVAVAEALALATVSKQRLEKSVLRVFTVHPRCEDAFVATALPLREKGVRKALLWHLGQDRSTAAAAVERAVEAAGDDPERRVQAAFSAARAYYAGRYRRTSPARRAGGPVHWADPHSRGDASALAAFAAAVVLGVEEVGADLVVGALRGSFASRPEDALSPAVFDRMRALAAQRETGGEPPALPAAGLTADTARQLDRLDYATLCTIRDVLAVLVESALPLRLARRAGLHDPALGHIERVRTANPRVRRYLQGADWISRHPPARAWQGFVPLLISICASPPDLETFQRDITALDPALDDVHALGQRAVARLAASRPATARTHADGEDA